ncbi:hypothetical protein YC2023_109106 [Brassica napus]
MQHTKQTKKNKIHVNTIDCRIDLVAESRGKIRFTCGSIPTVVWPLADLTAIRLCTVAQ